MTNTVASYIEHQEKHHQTITFKQKFLKLLEKHKIPYDERYLWD